MGEAMTGSETVIFALVVGSRLLVPLLVFRYPLPAILASLVIDGVDQTVFQTFTDLPLHNYQSYDKALDIYYQSLAYVSTLRNWTSLDAVVIGRFLLYYRMVGVLAFELSGGNRALLLVFPNTFEFFFIFYEAVRCRWDPAIRSRRFWLWAAAGLWVFVKLPQEYWIHIAQIDTTDLIADKPWVGVLMAVGVVGLLAVYWFVIHPRLDPPDHPFRLRADAPAHLLDSVGGLAGDRARGRIFDVALLEKFILVTVIAWIFALILPDVHVSAIGLACAIGVVVVTNAGVGQFAARQGWGLPSAAVEFIALAALNSLLVLAGELLRGRDLRAAPALFFVLLVTLIVVAFDRCRPVYEARRSSGTAPTPAPGGQSHEQQDRGGHAE
jgi:hypothetical protein